MAPNQAVSDAVCIQPVTIRAVVECGQKRPQTAKGSDRKDGAAIQDSMAKAPRVLQKPCRLRSKAGCSRFTNLPHETPDEEAIITLGSLGMAVGREMFGGCARR